LIWAKCFRETGRCAAKARGGSTSPLEKHADFLLALIEVEPDLTLDEVVGAMRKHKIPNRQVSVRKTNESEPSEDASLRSKGRQNQGRFVILGSSPPDA
jgi:hypothetical protein